MQVCACVVWATAGKGQVTSNPLDRACAVIVIVRPYGARTYHNPGVRFSRGLKADIPQRGGNLKLIRALDGFQDECRSGAY